MQPEFLIPDWPAPPHVKAVQTTRRGGCSEGPYASLNLGDHVGDIPAAVAANRAVMSALLPSEPYWLEQVHGIEALRLPSGGERVADAAWTSEPGQICTVMTADCLPLLLCDRSGQRVAAIHAGWRGLCHGVIESTVAAMACPPDALLAWLGPAIGPEAFEVGPEVREAFLERAPRAGAAFVSGSADRWLADIYQLARQRLNQLGVQAIYGGGQCTYRDAEQFFSYRRDGQTGRMATCIWIAAESV